MISLVIDLSAMKVRKEYELVSLCTQTENEMEITLTSFGKSSHDSKKS
jgi:hypothetical protein